MATTTFAWIVLLCPLVGTIVIGGSYKVLKGRTAGVIGTAVIGLAFAFSLATLVSLLSHDPQQRELTSSVWDYARTLNIDARMSILVDPLSVFMMLVVTGVSMLIHLYSVAYMASDRGYTRFFAFLNFFVFSMLLLVLAGNFILLIAGWAFVGAASYMLISFWYRRSSATRAGLKAFVINVVGDVGLVLGTFFIFGHTGTVDFIKTFHAVPHVFVQDSPDLVAGALLLLVGAFAKSAQVPLHTWLPDAMEGPTPVSALIHAATMVTAGVYLIARMHVIFELAPAAADVGAIIGGATLLIAASIGLVVTDLKRVIAYSTMSQIGYMVMAVSVGAYSAGLYHLMTHAFFKALLFMAAGSVISAMGGVQSLDRMGGFRKAMPFTFVMFLVGGLALSGLPPFSGWLSKDDIIGFLDHRGGGFLILGIVGYIGALMTAIYTFRMIFRTFLGEPVPEARELQEGHLHHVEKPVNPANGEVEDLDVGFPGPEHHIAERAMPMKLAMSGLAVLAIVGGAGQIPGIDHALSGFLDTTFADSTIIRHEPSTSAAWIGLVIGAAIALAGIGIAYRVWIAAPGTSAKLIERFGPIHTFLINKWYFDEAIDFVIVRPALWFGRFGNTVIERVLVAGVITGGTVSIVRACGALVRRAQTGFLRYYAAAVLAGITLTALYFLITSS
jgi:NADH-quinone oxidoreductase subunit L